METINIFNPLPGKTLEYNYGELMYEVVFESENKLHWKCVKGRDLGKESDETYFTQQLNNHTFFISWIEADGMGVSQVLNLKENVINCFLKIDSNVISVSGTMREM